MQQEAVKRLFDISGRVALVTGGRRGLGLAMSEGLAAAGAKLAVAAASRDAGDLRGRVAACGGELAYFQVDLARRQQREGLIEKVTAPLRAARHSCQLRRHPTPPARHRFRVGQMGRDSGPDAHRRVRAFPAGGPRHGAAGRRQNHQHRLPVQFPRGMDIPAYAAAKHGIAGLTKALANEWAARNIHVNALAPGYFDTEMCQAIINDPVREPKIRDRIPAGRWGRAEDLVGPLLFLASDAGNYVDGHILVVDGGWMAR